MNCSLFVVDDDLTYQRLIKLIFVKYPVFKHVLYFNDGKELLRYLTEFRDDAANLPDLIFLDLNMPDLDGWSVLDTIEKMYRKLDKKVIVYIVSVSIRLIDKERASEYSFVREFISKPLYKDKIISIAEEFNNNLIAANEKTTPLN